MTDRSNSGHNEPLRSIASLSALTAVSTNDLAQALGPKGGQPTNEYVQSTTFHYMQCPRATTVQVPGIPEVVISGSTSAVAYAEHHDPLYLFFTFDKLGFDIST